MHVTRMIILMVLLPVLIKAPRAAWRSKQPPGAPVPQIHETVDTAARGVLSSASVIL